MKKHKPLPTKSPALQIPQTERMQSAISLEVWGNLTHGITPTRLRRILEDADLGNIVEQHKLFADMEDRCEHLAAELGKRKRALLTLDWDIVPASDDKLAVSLAQKARVYMDMLPDFEDMLLDMADGIGHGFAALEIEWEYENGLHIPCCISHRPQTWFTCNPLNGQNRNELRLRNGSYEGEELWPLGWIVHTHKSKSGWLPRYGLFRVLAWAYLIRQYAQESEILFTQAYGLPLRLGKYPAHSSEEEKQALAKALRYLGRDAAGIIPDGMEIIFQSPSTSTIDIPGQLVKNCEMGMSKAILGGTLTSQADGKTSTNALGNVHNEVRHDLLAADASQIANTLTRQLIAPLLLLNNGVQDKRLLPYFRFDTRQAADIAVFADALPKLSPIMDISAAWAHEKLKIPRAINEDDILGKAARERAFAPQAPVESKGLTHASGSPASNNTPPLPAQGDPMDALVSTPPEKLGSDVESLLAPLLAMLDKGAGPAEIEAAIGELCPQMDEAAFAETLARAQFVAAVWGQCGRN